MIFFCFKKKSERGSSYSGYDEDKPWVLLALGHLYLVQYKNILCDFKVCYWFRVSKKAHVRMVGKFLEHS